MATTASSHLVLARKWRPERFDELVGQEHVTRTLVQALRSGRIAHAFLFTGIRGVGKTTAARILARCLNCEQGPTPEPCGVCAACLEVRAGAALDVVEIDGATYRKIDDARAIIENLSYRPARDRFKIYIIDEAHQLTDQAFNALLKTLEEPPPHVKFILATTEPQKMPETILSRLQRYDFRRIPFAMILARLRELATREAATADDDALSLIAREAGGSMRDAERMLETAIAALEGKVTEAEVASILGVAGRSRIFTLADAILGKDAATALATVRDLHRRGANLESLGRDLLEVLRNLAVAKLPAGGDSSLNDLPDQEATEIRRIAERASGRDLMRLFHLMADAQEQLLRSPYPDLLLEMAVIRMATIAPVLDADELMRALGNVGASGAAPPASSSTPVPSAPSPARRDTAASASVGARRIPLAGEVKAAAPRANPASSPSPPPSRSTPATPAPSLGDLPELRDFIRARRAALAGFMEQGAALALKDDVVVVSPRNDIYIRYLTDNRNVIAELASELYGRTIRAEVAVNVSAADAVSATAVSTTPSAIPAAPSRPAVVSPVPTTQLSTPSADVDSGSANGVLSAGVPAAPVSTQAAARQAILSDPVARRIFNEFEARLVEVRQVAPRLPEADAPIVKPDPSEEKS